jgi:hypothetical protein
MGWIARKLYKASGEGISPVGALYEVDHLESGVLDSVVTDVTEEDSRGLCKEILMFKPSRVLLGCLFRLHSFMCSALQFMCFVS